MDPYEGKKVVIVGGTSGIGLATAKMLVDGGARVLVTGRSQANLDSTQKELGKGSVAVSSDARSLTDIDALASRVKAEFDTFDLLFVNAGFSASGPIESMTEAVYDEMFNLNVKGPFFAVQKLAPLITRGGSVVLTTSTANIKGMPLIGAYGGAKAALRFFAQMFAVEFLPRGIRVNAVSPGPTETAVVSKVFPIPMKCWGASDEIAKAVLFLAFDATDTTGAELPVEDGLNSKAWESKLAFKVGPATFGIFDTFKDETGRTAHVNGKVAKALFARAEELFVSAPQIQTADILAEKL